MGVIDVRGEWGEGHAPCAHHIQLAKHPESEEQVRQLANGDLTYPIVIYCRTGKTAGRAKRILRDNGWTHVTNAGGWQEDAESITAHCNCGGKSDKVDEESIKNEAKRYKEPTISKIDDSVIVSSASRIMTACTTVVAI